MKIQRVLVAVGIGVILVGAGAAGASASSGDSSDSPAQYTLANGQTLGPEDGLEVVRQSVQVTSGERVGESFPSTPAPGQVVPMTAWGTSFAYSYEILQTGYVGYGKAAANVYSGKRIVEVCFWWTRSGGAVSPMTCSDANFNGGWVQGPEKTYTVYDSLGWNDPHTIFNYQTVRIDPSAHW